MNSDLDNQALRHLIKARVLIQQRWPFMVSSIYALSYVPLSEFPTMFVTEGLVCAFNPEFILKQSVEQAAFCLLHEAQHPLREFFSRAKGVTRPDLFALASDMPINSDLLRGGWPKPNMGVGGDIVTPGTYKFPEGKTTEQYYNMLLQSEQESESSSSSGKSGGADSEEEGPGTRGVCQGGCRAPNKEVEQRLDKEFGRTPTETAVVVKQALQKIKEHIETKGRGSVPGSLEELIQDLDAPPRVDWRHKTQYIIRQACGAIKLGGSDFSLRFPSKRSYVRGFPRPGLIDQEIIPYFVLDTSGSMQQDMMVAGLVECISVLQQLGIQQAWYTEADTRLAIEPRMMSIHELKQLTKFHGRGGTDFRPAFDAIPKLRPKPDIIFYFTDGDGSSPNCPPANTETIWCLVPNSYSRRKPASWGHLVVISDTVDESQIQDPGVDDEDD